MNRLVIASILLAFPAVAANAEDFFPAIRNNNLPRLRELSREKEAVRKADSKGMTPLLYATVFGSVEAMKVLIDAGADVDAAEALGAAPLHWAACEPVRVKLLLQRGAKVNVATSAGRTPLMAAASCESGAESVELMLNAGADIDAHEKTGGTALMEALISGGTRSARMLLAAGARANVANERGFTPLMSAAGWNDVALVKELIAKGAKINDANVSNGTVRNGDIDMKKLTALMIAAPFASPEMVKALLDAGADVKMRDGRGMTPLMFAVAGDAQDPRVVQLLIGAGSDVNAKDRYGDSVLDWARKFNEPAVVALLEKAGAKGGPVRQAPVRREAVSADPREAVSKAVGLVQRSTTEFFKQSGCVGCHHQPQMMMAVKAARQVGAAVDEASVAEHRKAMVSLTAPRPTRLLAGGFIELMIEPVLGLAAAGYGPDILTDSAAVVLANRQTLTGGWFDASAASRSPLMGSMITLTVNCVRVLTTYSIPARKAEFDARIARARHWLLEAKPRTEFERAERLRGLSLTGASKEQVARAAGELLAHQRRDGGWGQREHLASDAWMTALAMEALFESGQVRANDPVYRRGVDYLLRTQMEDGSWYVRSRAVKLQPYFQSGFPYDHDQWISMTATAQAAVALSRAERGVTRASVH